MKKNPNKILEKTIKAVLTHSANTTTSINMYQPKIPKGLSNFKK